MATATKNDSKRKPLNDKVPERTPVEPGAEPGDLSGGEVNNGRVGG